MANKEEMGTRERKDICGRMALREIKKDERFLLAMSWVSLVFDIILLIGIFTSGSSARVKVAGLVLTGILAIATVAFFKQNILRKKLKRKLEGGGFRLVPCHIEKVDFDSHLTYGNEVSLVDDDGKPVYWRKLVAGFPAVEEWKADKDVRCWLVRCEYGADDEYARVYSEGQIQEEGGKCEV